MKQIIILLLSITFLLSLDSFAQLRPAQSQYLKEMGALVNPSFEQGYKGWDITGTCTQSLESDIPYLNKTLKLTCVNQQFSVKQNTTELTGFVDQQALLTAQVKANIGSAFIRTLNNDVEASSASIIAGEYKAINIPDKIASTSNGVEIHTNGVNVTGEFFIDEVGYRLAPDLSYQVGQAQFVGEIDLSNNCLYRRNNATFGKLLDTDSNCSATSISGNLSLPTNTNEAGIKINNFRSDGYYKLVFQGVLYNAGNTDACRFTFSKTTSNEGKGIAYAALGNNGSREQSQLIANIRFQNSDTGEVFVLSRSNSPTNCEVYGESATPANISVHFFPDSNSTIVSQQTELCEIEATGNDADVIDGGFAEDIPWKNKAKDNCNIFNNSGNTGNDTNDAIVPTVSDWYSITLGVDTVAAGNFGISLYENGSLKNFINVSPNAGVAGQAHATGTFYLTKGNFYTFRINLASTLQNKTTDHYLHVLQQPKNKTIIGKFEQIEEITGDLTAETANELSAQISWNGSTYEVTSQNYDFISSITTPSGTGRPVVNFNTGVFNNPASCTCTIGGAGFGASSGDFECTVNDAETGNVEFNLTGSGFVNTNFSFVCSKQGADVNKQFKGAIIQSAASSQEIADIVREDIISTDLCQVEANDNDGEFITANTEDMPFKTEVKDNCNAWGNGGNTENNTNDQYIAQKNGFVLMVMNIGVSGAAAQALELYENGTAYKRCFTIPDGSTNKGFVCLWQATKDSAYTFRLSSGGTLISSVRNHNIQITELPDNASILESLNQNPRLQNDQYSESEIKWGKWNGEQLYRRCFTVASDITTTGTTITTWDSGLNPINVMNYDSTNWELSFRTLSSSFRSIIYSSADGTVKGFMGGGWKIGAGETHCMDYTR